MEEEECCFFVFGEGDGYVPIYGDDGWRAVSAAMCSVVVFGHPDFAGEPCVCYPPTSLGPMPSGFVSVGPGTTSEGGAYWPVG